LTEKTGLTSFHHCAQGMFYVLNDKINNMPGIIEEEFERKYPGLINELKLFLEQDTFDCPSDDVLENADDWWNDV